MVVLMIHSWLLQPVGSRTVLEGAYTAAQAERGKLVYDARCSRCHASDLHGVRGAALSGDAFMLHWDAHSVGRLFQRIRDSMPPDGSATLDDAERVDVVAFVLQQNGFPSGSGELPADLAALNGILIKSRTPSPLRTGALVQSTGCLTQDADGWLLAKSTELEATSLDDRATRAAPAPSGVEGTHLAGDRIVRLMNVFPSPAAHRGHTMIAKGFLVKDSSGDRINVATLEMIDSVCAQ
jgi:mono/diheme cytochrome c family protein